MKTSLCIVAACVLQAAILLAQDTGAKPQPRTVQATEAQGNHASSGQDASDVEQLRADIEHLKVLLNQMRTNLAFVQTSQTPLKHQFELEIDAWQVIAEQMERRLKRMEDHGTPGEPRR